MAKQKSNVVKLELSKEKIARLHNARLATEKLVSPIATISDGQRTKRMLRDAIADVDSGNLKPLGVFIAIVAESKDRRNERVKYYYSGLTGFEIAGVLLTCARQFPQET